MSQTVNKPAPNQNIRFKESEDALKWDVGAGSAVIRAWIMAFNEISNAITGRGIVVTSWYRNDGAYHQDGVAFDVRRLSEANKAMGKEAYTPEQVSMIEQRVASRGLPIHIISKGEPNEHWHVGPIKWSNS